MTGKVTHKEKNITVTHSIDVDSCIADEIEKLKFENANKGLCVMCGEPVIKGRMTCSKKCHEEFIEFCEKKFGIMKKVVDSTTEITYKVPTRDIIEKGLTWKDLVKYPIWEDNKDNQ